MYLPIESNAVARTGSADGPDLDRLSDIELRAHETRVDVRGRKSPYFVPAFPTSILTSVVQAKAEKALPTLLAIHRQLAMTRREYTPLSAAVWSAAGDPSEKKRATIVRKLKLLPEVVKVEPHRTAASHYRVARGPLWSSLPSK
jgi:hypothetical protein